MSQTPKLTLEQVRAANAWACAQGCGTEYQNLAKGLPALIMNSGLMQVLAFLHEKGSKQSQRHCQVLGDQLRAWLSKRFPRELPDAKFVAFMESLMNVEPRRYQEITAEAFAWLRWVRQMAPAVRVSQ